MSDLHELIAKGHETYRALRYFILDLQTPGRIGMGLAVVGARDAELRGFRQDAFPGHRSHEHYQHKKKQRAFH